MTAGADHEFDKIAAVEGRPARLVAEPQRGETGWELWFFGTLIDAVNRTIVQIWAMNLPSVCDDLLPHR